MTTLWNYLLTALGKILQTGCPFLYNTGIYMI